MKQRAIKSVEHLEDVVLWQAFKQGDQQAYATIYHQYVRLLFQYGCRLCPDRELVKDAIQDLFYYLWEHRSNLGDVQHIQYYLITALRRKIIELQKADVSNEIDEQTIVIPSAEKKHIEAETERDNQRYLHQGLNNLTERQREAIFLRYYQDMPVREIAQVMQVQRRAVYQLLQGAIQTLTKMWPEMAKKMLKLVLWGVITFGNF
ncbi:MAG: sigma-70 family RNA polymerase sigma factor [Tunicatimonas sp.]|uniref:RNA polymerase sigma factor n=1 Tax=Tunicatimonas sp. TaxID=1940096 RepID=UPI003C771C99